MSYLDRINDCVNYSPSSYIPLFLNESKIGQVPLVFIHHLSSFVDFFKIQNERVTFFPLFDTYEGRTETMAQICAKLRTQGLITGWRNELYPVSTSFAASPLFAIERSAAPLFGVKAYGVHLNGFINKNNETFLWVGKRSRSKTTSPSKLEI